MPINLVRHFQELHDPRVVGRCDHKLVDIIAIALAGQPFTGVKMRKAFLTADERGYTRTRI